VLGSLVMWRLGLFHIPLAFIAAFLPLTWLRSAVTGHPFLTELAPMTSPMFQLFIFFMITDPKTITKARWSQVLGVHSQRVIMPEPSDLPWVLGLAAREV